MGIAYYYPILKKRKGKLRKGCFQILFSINPAPGKIQKSTKPVIISACAFIPTYLMLSELLFLFQDFAFPVTFQLFYQFFCNVCISNLRSQNIYFQIFHSLVLHLFSTSLCTPLNAKRER